MRINVLHEEAENKPVLGITRAKKDFKQIQELDGLVHGGKGWKPPISHIVAAAKHNGQIVGYAVAKPYSKVAYNRRSGVHPDFEKSDLLYDLTKFLVDWCRQSGFEYHTARSDESNSGLYSSIYGDPVKNRQYKHKKVDMFRTDLSTEAAVQRTPSRAGPRLRSDKM